jgi:hypothetical protein
VSKSLRVRNQRLQQVNVINPQLARARPPFIIESLRASPERDEGTNVDEVEMIDNVQLFVSLSKHSEFFFSTLFSKVVSRLIRQ